MEKQINGRQSGANLRHIYMTDSLDLKTCDLFREMGNLTYKDLYIPDKHPWCLRPDERNAEKSWFVISGHVQVILNGNIPVNIRGAKIVLSLTHPQSKRL